MPIVLRTVAVAVICLTTAAASAGSFTDQCRAAKAALADPLKDGGELITQGRTDEAARRLLAVFPDADRTAAQAFMLGNLLYDFDPTRSYALHREAYDKAPGEEAARWEWALERHRAREYAEAATLYRASIAADPRQAIRYAMLADCLIRTDTPEAAAAAWRGSETAVRGSIERMEEMVCIVYKNPWQYRMRDGLLAKVARGDVDAAVALMSLDCRWESDWWNAGPHESFLTHDADAIAAAKLPHSGRTDAIACVLDCYRGERTRERVAVALTRYRLLTDANATLPADGVLAALLFRAALESEVLDAAAVTKTFGDRLLAAARRTGDFDWWNSALYARTGEGISPADTASLEREAWDATGAPIFAVGYAAAVLGDDKPLPADDPVITSARQRWPDSADVWRFAFATPPDDPAQRRAAVVQAIRAEFTHFSSSGLNGTGANVRPRATKLRGYFRELSDTARLPPASRP